MISVVIPSFNRKDYVLNLLADLHRQVGGGYEIIVVDDCSEDGSPAAIAAAYPQVLLLVNATNRGPAATRNRGIEAATQELVVGFDSDVSLRDLHLLSRVERAFIEQPQADGLAFRVYAPDGLRDDAPRWWHPVPLRTHAGRTFETSYFSGTAYAFRRMSAIRAGLFPEWLFIYYEEVALAYRVIANGGRIIYVPELGVIHHAAPAKRRNRIQSYYKPRNQVLLAVELFPWSRAFCYLLPRLTAGAGRAVINGYILAYLKALGDAVRMIPEVLRKRSPLPHAAWSYIALLSRKGYP